MANASVERLFDAQRGFQSFVASHLNAGRVLILLSGLLLTAFVHTISAHQMDLALESYRAKSLEEAERVSAGIETALKQIYQNLRTVSMLPSVRSIDRHGITLSSDARTSIHQIYNNLASNVAISEVYIVPADFDPDRVDPATGEGEVPILMFDELITAFPRDHAQHGDDQPHTHGVVVSPEEEVETFEYRQFKNTMSWIKQHHPNVGTIRGMNVPFISGQEVITCDNTEFNRTKLDADRQGVIFSVPFFDPFGNFKGTVSAIVRSNALKRLLTDSDFAIVNTANSYAAKASPEGQQNLSSYWIRRGEADPSLLFSRVLPINVNDDIGAWQFWVGHPNDQFLRSAEVVTLRNFRYAGLFAAGLGTLLGLGLWNWTVTRERRQAELGQWKDLSNAAVEGLVVCRDDILVAASRSFIEAMGLADGGIEGLTIKSLVDDAGAAERLRLPSGESVQTNLVGADGEKIPVEIISRAISYEGRPHRVLAIRDLRERKKAEQQIAGQIADLMALLAQNEKLREQLQRSNESVADINERLFRRVGSDLHDGPLQMLTYALMRLGKFTPVIASGAPKGFDGFERVREAIHDAMQELREISTGLALPELAASSLETCIRMAVASHKQRTDIEARCEIGTLPASVPHALKICVFRFVQEALNNGFRHGGGVDQHVTASGDSEIVITVSDAGPGFSLDELNTASGLGLSGLRARVGAIGGTLEISSEPFVATSLKAHFDLAKMQAGEGR